MRFSRIRGRRIVALASLTVALGVMAPAATRVDASANPGVLPPNSNAFGKTYAAWSVAWWQWALSIPTPSNPLLDQTGANCSVGQSDPVWFLAGLWSGSGTVTRSCMVPSGTALFVPLFNVECDTTPPDPIPPDQCPGLLAPIFAGLSGLEADVDGVAIAGLTTAGCPQVQGTVFVPVQPSYCVGSGTYAIAVPNDNIYGPGVPAGTYQAVNEGVYLLLAPLGVGAHTIHFATPSMDVTYHITVAPS